jgi:hypothetical protein
VSWRCGRLALLGGWALAACAPAAPPDATHTAATHTVATATDRAATATVTDRAATATATATDRAAAGRDVPSDPHRIGPQLEASLNAGELPFCRDVEHRLGSDERALCEFARASAERCPAFAAACAARADPNEETDTPAWARLLVMLFRVFGYLLFWVLLIAAVVLVLWLALRLWRAARPVGALAEQGEDGADPSSESDVPDFERAFEAHLGRARSLAAQGQFAEAAAEVQLGVVLRLDALGLILARRGRTNGDYARDLAARPELQAAFAELAHTTEAVQFGGRRLDPSSFQRLLEQAGPLLGALALLLGALGGPLACQSDASAPAQVSTASQLCGRGAQEHSLFCALFDSGQGVSQRFRPLAGPDAIAADVSTIVVLPNHLEDGAWGLLQAWLQKGGVAVFSTPIESIDRAFGVSRGSQLCGGRATVLPSGERSLLVSVGPSLVAPTVLPVLATCETGEPYIAETSAGQGRAIFLATPELLSNASLVAGDNARLLANLLDLPEGRVEIIGSLTRPAVQSPFSAVAAAGLTPWLCQLLLLAAAFAAYRGVPFGRRVEAPGQQRRRFSEHVQALGQRWAEQRASSSALGAYAGYGLELLRERVPVGAGRSSGDLARAVAQKTGREPAAVAKTLELSRRAQEGTGGANEAEDLQALRDLGRLIEDLGGPR